MTKKAAPAGKARADANSAVWRVPLSVDHILESGLHREIEASPEVLSNIARLAGVPEVKSLSAAFDIVREGAKVHVTGQVRARLAQNCVVTLEPIETAVDEPVDVTFAQDPLTGASAVATGEAREKQTDDAETPEPMAGGTLDLGALATEFMILGIDPYPRKAGVEFTPPKIENTDARPFSVLEVLKKSPGGDKA